MDDTSGRPAEDDRPMRDAATAPGVPRWVKILAVVGVAILIGVGIALATGHGPGRHTAHGTDGPARGGSAVAGDLPGARRI